MAQKTLFSMLQTNIAMTMKTLYTSLLLIFFGSTYAQVQGLGGVPTSNKRQFDQKLIEQWVFSQPDITQLKAEDAQTDGLGLAPWRFGYNNYTNLNNTNSGKWFDLPNGGKIWMLRVKCENALTVNLTFEQTSIPEGNKLFVYNPSKDFILGAFTQQHIYDGQLGTELIPGQEVVLEYYVAPKNIVGHVQLAIVTHGYRTASEYMEKAFGSSGSCNYNVNCAEGLPWSHERDGVVMLVSGSSGFCSGSLVNNTLNNGKPYVLTANHCYSNPATWVFRFNWQGSDCVNPPTSPSFQSLSGAVLRARDTPSDFCLVEITGGLQSGTVPTTYGPYFNGWDNSGSTPQSACGIHHPSGDIKKISIENDPLVSTTFGTCPANSHWGVTHWDVGVTEGGSSGSPLFDQNHHIIGQLHGGASACGAASLSDEYGKFSWSWNPAGTDSTKQLKYWLDPQNSGAAFIDGYDPLNSTPVALDAGLSASSLMLAATCGYDYTPKVSLLNVGSTTLTSATITYQIDNGSPQNYLWSGSLAQWQSQVISFSNITLAVGSHTFSASVSSPNAGTDENNTNNTSSTALTVVGIPSTTNLLKVNLLTDDYAEETYMELVNSAGVVVWSEGNESFIGNYGTGLSPAPTDNTAPLSNNTTYTYDIPISTADCYTFTIYDYYGDGIGAQQWGGTDGSLTLSDDQATQIFSLPAADFGASSSFNFINSNDAGVDFLQASWKLFPNPTANNLTIESFSSTMTRIQIQDIYGKIIQDLAVDGTNAHFNIQSLSSGTYFVRVFDVNGQFSTRSFIKK